MRLRLAVFIAIVGVYAAVGFAQQSGFRVNGVESTGAGVCGSDTQVQFNDAGACGGDAGLTYVKGTDTLTVASTVKAEAVQDSGQQRFQLDATGLRTISSLMFQWTSGGGTFNSVDTALGRNAAGVVEFNNGTAGTYADAKLRMLRVGQATPPTCSASCGTSPSVSGSDTAMTVTMGATGAPASPFTVTFNTTWAAAPSCTANASKTGMVAGKAPILVVPSTTTVVVTTNGTAPGTADTYTIHCIGVQ